MPNEIKFECFFKSADLAKLCQGSEHIIVQVKASYSSNEIPKFEISANKHVIVNATQGFLAAPAPKTEAIPGCPTPCHP